MRLISPVRRGCLLASLAAGCAAPSPAASPASPHAEQAPGATPAEPEEANAAPPTTPAEQSTAEPPGASSAPGGGPADTRSKEDIQRVVAEGREGVRACYDAALAQNPGIEGDLVVEFVISPSGDVKQAEVRWAESDIHVPELDTCAVEAVRSLEFPPSSRGLESKVTYPFNFHPPRPPAPKR